MSWVGPGFNPESMAALVKARQSELLKEAAIERLLAQANTTRPRLPDRLLTSIGSLLIFIGQWLQGRDLATTPYSAGACQPGC